MVPSYATLATFQMLGDLFERHGQHQQAFLVYEAAYQRFEDEMLFPGQIRTLKRLSRTTEALIVNVKCFATGQVELPRQCSEATKA